LGMQVMFGRFFLSLLQIRKSMNIPISAEAIGEGAKVPVAAHAARHWSAG